MRPADFFFNPCGQFKLFDETRMTENLMDLTLDSIDVLDLGACDDSKSFNHSDSFQYFDNCYSFSVVYRMNDFPFPSIHYPPQRDNYVEDQLPWDSCFGSSSAFSTPEPFGYLYTDCPKLSPKGRLSMPFSSETKDVDSVMTPVKMIDLSVDVEDSSGLENGTGEVKQMADAAGPQRNSPKETSSVEFRSGYRGVSWNRRMKAWLAVWSEGKNRRSKTFNAKVMGFDKARAAAIDFLKRKKQLLQQADEHGSIEGNDEEEFGEGSSLADTATTSSDSSSSDAICSSCAVTDCSCSSG